MKAKDTRPRGIIQPPGVLVPDFYFDPKTKVYGCFVRPWEDILVEELEQKMRSNRNGDTFDPSAWQQLIAGSFKDYVNGEIFIDSEISFKELELRTLAVLNGQDPHFFTTTVLKNRGTCRPTTTTSSISLPSSVTSSDSARKGCETTPSLESSASNGPPSIDG